MEENKVNIGYRHFQTMKISEGAFADDIIIIAGSKRDLQYNLNKWNAVLEQNGVNINKSNDDRK